MSDVQFGGVPFKEAIAFLLNKKQVPTERWDQMLGEAHAKAFTVAGATKADLLNDLNTAVSEAIKNGQSFNQFRQKFAEITNKHGWSYNGKEGWRARVIYDNNMRTARMAGRWQQIQATKKTRPYLVYMTVRDERVRDDHRSWHAVALPVDHPWWNTHYPPNDYGCRCYVISANERMLKRMGIEVSEAPEIKLTERINPKTGEVYGEYPEGVGVGWNYNVGKAWLGPDIALGEKLVQLPTEFQKSVLAGIEIGAINQAWKAWKKQVDSEEYPRGFMTTVGFLDPALITALKGVSIEPKSAAIIVQDSQTKHLQGDHKNVKKRIPEEWLEDLPLLLSKYEAVLYHKGTSSILFVLPGAVNGKKARAVVEVNFKRKGKTYNSLRSLGVMDIKHLRKAEFELLLGEIK